MNKNTVVILDNIRSRENVGSIFRTSDAVGVKKIYLCGITPTPAVQFSISNFQFSKQSKKTDKIAKTALGAEKWVPWEYHKQTWRLIEQLKKEGYKIVALEKTRNAEDIFGFKSKSKVALIVGNEVNGLSPETLKRSHKIVAIPQYGQKESLNVAVAFGIATYLIVHNHY
ncbi:MAG: hypothetical protein A2735_02665 [Candidatus Yanofskybacteria bacterium RIFCSPHIGHO2_01_FULL_41_21]|uniref:tRNA/rRNA methyltransferase SpoU type domain-containing protein n=1 Tax=Candidatus Yanofskybacteria bacterium RIFCSPHIGHO2_01_FULL_41_21 TaxID=1802660 RepID=A0A1F8EAB8_9BACT|nr:MAG: hypothetical protein A2735_02665 [Candidatus Yanofskybacteria bacterium RIFCSPHIGHO2_01_FULL_41_21]